MDLAGGMRLSGPANSLRRAATLGGVVFGLVATIWCVGAQESSAPYGMVSRPPAKAYLSMPEQQRGALPRLLSQTGAFEDTASLAPARGLIPYDLNVPFWSDGAAKSRWIAVPNTGSLEQNRIRFSPTGEWSFPKGTVFVKHFELSTDETRPELKRRLETRLLVCDSTGGVYGVTYKWRNDNSEADLLVTNVLETVVVKTRTGSRTQKWYYPSPQDCRTCHTDRAGGVLGVKTRQLNRDFAFPSGIIDNQLRAWNHVGLFEGGFDEAGFSRYPKLAPAEDGSRSLEDRARSYLDANCAQCHRPGGTVAFFDARYDTPLAQQNLIGGRVLIDEGVDRARVIAPNDIWRSIALMRISTLDGRKMPSLAHEVLDLQGQALLRRWIESLPGPPVLAPPVISPSAGNFEKPLEVGFNQNEPGAEIHYTLDGSVPTASDPLYVKPLKLARPTILRARAFKPGFTRSITVQGVFIIEEHEGQ